MQAAAPTTADATETLSMQLWLSIDRPDFHAGALLLAAVLIRLNTALTVKRDGEEVVVADGHAVALEYVRSGAVLTDLLTIIPTILQVSTAPSNSQTCSLPGIRCSTQAVHAINNR